MASRDSAGEKDPPFLFLYFRKIRGCPVRREGDKARIGRLYDLIVEPAIPYPRAAGIVIRCGLWKTQYRPWSEVRAVNPYEIIVAEQVANPSWTPNSSMEQPGRDWLGQLAIEVSNRSVVRLYDFHLLYSENILLLAHAETGPRGWLRRLGLEQSVLMLLSRLFPALRKERFATFRHLQILKPDPRSSKIRLPPRLLEMDPPDLETVIARLPSSLRRSVFASLPDELAARVLQETPAEFQARLLRSIPPARQATLEQLRQKKN